MYTTRKASRGRTTLLEAVEATIRTIRLGVLPERQLTNALQQILHRYGASSNHGDKRQPTHSKTTQQQERQGYSKDTWAQQGRTTAVLLPCNHLTTAMGHGNSATGGMQSATQPAKAGALHPRLSSPVSGSTRPKLTTAGKLLEAISNGHDPTR